MNPSPITGLVERLRTGFVVADEIACAAIENGFYVGEGLLDKLADAREALSLPHPTIDREAIARAFKLGDRVEKVSGSAWHGVIVGFYSTKLTPVGYAVESEREPGSVQIYPEKALRAALHPIDDISEAKP